MTLISENMPPRTQSDTISAFGTPTVVHFCASLLVAAILSMPWSILRPAGMAIAACGVLGIVYSVIVLRRALRQGGYRPVFEDWLWHTILPALAYVTLLVAGLDVERNSPGGLFAIGPAALLLVFVGIHNAWDTVTYVTVTRRGEREIAAGGAGTERASTGSSSDSAPAGSTANLSESASPPRASS
jgi:hypothetical protein